MIASRIAAYALLFVSASACTKSPKESETVERTPEPLASAATPEKAPDTMSMAAMQAQSEQQASQQAPGRLFTPACSQCLDKPCGMEVQACTGDERCSTCLAGGNCSGQLDDVKDRWRAACGCVKRACYTACFLGGAPVPTCP